jgi:hypothetical protein
MVRTLLLIGCLSLSPACTGTFANLPSPDKESESLEEATELLRQERYDEAITALSTLDSATLSKRDVKRLFAGAYAGRAGVDAIEIIDDLESHNSNILPLLMLKLKGFTTSDVNDITSAETLLLQISADANLRSQSENLFLAVLSLAKAVGTFLVIADQNQNGLVDSGFNACDSTDLPQDSVEAFGKAIALSYQSLSATTSIAVLTETYGDLTSLCAGATGLYAFCSLTEGDTVTTEQREHVRGAIRERDAFGTGRCSGSAATCRCGS